MRVVTLRFGGRSLGLPLSSKALDHLQLADGRRIGLCRSVEVELAFHQLQARRPGDRFGGREDRKDAIGRHLLAAAELPLPRGSFMDVFRADRLSLPPRRERQALN